MCPVLPSQAGSPERPPPVSPVRGIAGTLGLALLPPLKSPMTKRETPTVAGFAGGTGQAVTPLLT